MSKGGKTKKDDSEVFKKPLLPPPMKMMKNEMLPETKEGKDTTQYLRNWIPKLRGRKLRLEGDLWDAKQNEYHQARWKSSTIKRRKTNTLLEVGKSLKIYVLEGKLSVDHAMTENIPEFIIQTFMVITQLRRALRASAYRLRRSTRFRMASRSTGRTCATVGTP